VYFIGVFVAQAYGENLFEAEDKSRRPCQLTAIKFAGKAPEEGSYEIFLRSDLI